MLNFLIKKRVEKLMIRGYNSGYNNYKRNLIDGLERGCTAEEIQNYREIYIEDVSEYVANFIYNFTDGKIIARHKIAGMHPKLAFPGYTDDAPYCVGLEYCIAIYAFLAIPGKASDAIRQNHIFAAYVNKAIEELQNGC